MNFNKKQATFNHSKNFFFAVIFCFLLALAFSAQSVFAEEESLVFPKASSDLTYYEDTEHVLVDVSGATSGVTWEYAVTITSVLEAPQANWSTDIPKRDTGRWKIWCRNAGDKDKLTSFEVEISAETPLSMGCPPYLSKVVQDLVYISSSAQDKTWEFAVTRPDVKIEPKYGWSTEIPKRGIGDWKVWYRTEGSSPSTGVHGSLLASIKINFGDNNGADATWPILESDVVATGTEILLGSSGILHYSPCTFYVTRSDDTFDYGNMSSYEWTEEAYATEPGDYKVWVAYSPSPDDGLYLAGYAPVTIHCPPPPKLYVYTLKS